MSECVYCQNTFEMNETCSDEFRMWQGLVGPYYTPTVDEEGILSWTNTGDLPNPDPIDISGPPGESFSIAGIVETVSQLPSGGAEGVWLVGASAPYEGYSYVGGEWADIGQLAIGPQGPQGEAGQNGTPAGFGTPTATITNTTGTPSVTITASGPDTAKVFAFAFANLKGAKGDTGSKGDPGEVTQAEFDSLADDVDELKTNLSNAILQASSRSKSGNGTVTHSLTGLTANHVVSSFGMFSDSECTIPIPENAPTCDITIETGAGQYIVTIENFTSTFYMKPTFVLPQN